MIMISDFAYMHCNNMSTRKGFSLIEAVVYVALLGIISIFIANAVVFLVRTYARTRAEREVLSNARSIMTTISSRVASSQDIYNPTSRFDVDAGQLSLVTMATSTTGHTGAYADFWADSGVVYMREEGEAIRPLSAGSVRISVLRFERIIESLGRSAVRMTIQADAAFGAFPASATLITTTALRGNY